MARQLFHPSWLSAILVALFITLPSTSYAASEPDKKVYIVYMGEPPKGEFSSESLHVGMLEQVLGSSAASESLVYSYKKSFNGFAAKLSEEEMQKLAGMEGIVSVFPSKKNQLHTTRSWDFMGFSQNVKRRSIESDIIVGLLDTGIWPESDSFSDEGMSPPPKKWKGKCQASGNFTCNNKLIGARFYHGGSKDKGDSPRDTEGHGTHTASTAAGRVVSGASLLGLGEGTARGAVPSARIAMYKVCWEGVGCADEDILAAFDDAIADGVDIISVSLGGSFPSDYFQDTIAIGSFHAMKKGILTSNSAGNSGPGPATLSNFSPWSLTVAASTIDRRFMAKVQLGNGKSYEGAAINTFQLKHGMYDLVYGGNVPNKSAGYDRSSSRYCEPNSLNKNLVKGKVVLCDQLSLGMGPLLADAVGTVMQDSTQATDFAFAYAMPATFLNLSDGGDVLDYIKRDSNPKATIFKSEEIKDKSAPFVVSFSSRGPNPITKNILKPDLSGPGADILAAWSPVSPLTYPGDKRVVSYNIISGTSMSCPHVTGAAAYIKSFHPTWSPAALKSALMTTAYPMSAVSNKDAEFAYGSGHINPVQAVNPGLVYDASEADYVAMLCNDGYNTTTLRLVTGDNSSCANVHGTVWDLNYPSFALAAVSGKLNTASYNRTVTNVGSPNSTYKAFVTAPVGLDIKVEPNVLSFKSLGEKLSFIVKVTTERVKSPLSASLIWKDGVYQVRSPVMVYPNSTSS